MITDTALAIAVAAGVFVACVALFWCGLTIGYRVRLRRASLLQWPERPAWAPRRPLGPNLFMTRHPFHADYVYEIDALATFPEFHRID